MDWVGARIAPTQRGTVRRALTVVAAVALALTAVTAPLGAAVSEAAEAAPVINGKPRVGDVLTAEGIPAGADIQWLRENTPGTGTFNSIGSNFKSPSYTVRAKDLGQRLAVRTTPPGGSSTVAEPTDPVQPGTFSPLMPQIVGDPKVGKTLTVSPLAPSAGTVTVTWLRNGAAIGKTGPSYTLVVEDLRTRISAIVTQSAEGYEPLTETTDQTAVVTSQRYLFASKPKVSGTVKVGRTLTVKRGTWTAGTKFSYQWYAAGKRIKGATKKTFTVTRAQRGKLMKVRVTGTKPKYENRAMLSEPAKIAGIRGPRNKNGWAWPTDTRLLTQGYHEGVALDLASSAGGPIFAAYKGTVVEAGGDGFGMPGFCPAAWWRGQNQTVVIRHVYNGKVLYSAVNHVAAGSSKALGIKVGTRVRSGQQIATEGMSGCTSGPHTHFVMRRTQFNWNGEVKPLGYIGKPRPQKGGAGARADFGVYGTDLPVLRVG